MNAKELKDIKSKYESGDYILVLSDGFKNWKPDVSYGETWALWSHLAMYLIHKKHEDILDAYLKDNSIKIYFRWHDEEWMKFKNFIENYEEKAMYKITTDKIDLHETYCMATVDNYRELVKLNPRLDLNIHMLYFTLREVNKEIRVKYVDSTNLEEIEGLKQIYLVNGQFQYVTDIGISKLKPKIKTFNSDKISQEFTSSKIEVKEECSFNKHGFETPPFKGEIFKEVQGNKSRNTKRFIGHAINENGVSYPCIWEEWGECNFCTSVKIHEFNLTPIKKEWYQDLKNVGKLIINKHGEVRKITDINLDTKKVGTHSQNLYMDAIPNWRPLTEGEALSLTIDGDE